MTGYFPTRMFLDTEFREYRTNVDLLSLGLVDEAGREFYAIDNSFHLPDLRDEKWLLENIVPSLPIVVGTNTAGRVTDIEWDTEHPDYPLVRSREEIATDLLLFLDLPNTPKLELWGLCSGFDYVLLCRLFGRMIESPDGMPHYMRDLQSRRDEVWELRQRRGIPGEPHRPPDPAPGEHHNALADARWNLRYYQSLTDELERLLAL